MDVVTLFNYIESSGDDILKYFRQLQSLKSSDFADVVVGKILIEKLTFIIDHEFQNAPNNDEEKVSIVAYKGLLNSSSSEEVWGDETLPVVSLLKHWFKLCKSLLEHNFDKWWEHFVIVLSFIEESCNKNQSIRVGILNELTGELLELITGHGLPLSAVKSTVKTLNSCASDCPREVRAQLSPKFQTYFVQLAHMIIECGDAVGQSVLLETLLRFLVLRSNRISRVEAAKLWFPQTAEWRDATNVFQNRNFHNFDADCRVFLNAVNEVTQSVTSVGCHSAYIGDLQLLNLEESDNDDDGVFWVDLNHGPGTLSMGCDARCILPHNAQCDQVWETITVHKHNVSNVQLLRCEEVAVMQICLRGPPECVSRLSRAALQKQQYAVRVKFHLDMQLRRVNKALARIFADTFKEVEESTLELWISSLVAKQCSEKRVVTKQKSTRRERFSDSDEANVGGASRFSPLMHAPPTTARRQGKVSRAARSNIVSRYNTPTFSIASSTSIELAQLRENLRKHNSVKYTNQMEMAALSPALTNITEENYSIVLSAAPSLPSQSSRNKPSVAARRNIINTNRSLNTIPQLASSSSSSSEDDVRTLLTFCDDEPRTFSKKPKYRSKNEIIENILRLEKKPIVVLEQLNPNLLPPNIPDRRPSTPKRQSSVPRQLLEKPKVQSLADQEEQKNKLEPTKALSDKPKKTQSQLSIPIKEVEFSKPNIHLSESEEIQTPSSHPEKAAETSPRQTSALDNSTPHREESKPDNAILSEEAYKTNDSGIIVTDVSQFNSLFLKQFDQKEYTSDVSVILDTPENPSKSIGSKRLFTKYNTDESASRIEKYKIFKSKKKFVSNSSNNNSVSDASALHKKEPINLHGSLRNPQENDFNNVFEQNVLLENLQKSQNPVFARHNNFSSPETDHSINDVAIKPTLTTQLNVNAEDVKARASNKDSESTNKSNASDKLKGRMRRQRLVKNISSVSVYTNPNQVPSTDQEIADDETPYRGAKKRRRLYSPKDAFSFQSDNNSEDDENEIAKLTKFQNVETSRRLCYTSTTSFEDIDKQKERQGRKGRNKNRNKRTNITTKDQKKIRKLESSTQNHVDVYSFSEDSRGSSTNKLRNTRLTKKKLQQNACKEKLTQPNHDEDFDSNDEFKASNFTPKRKWIKQKIARVREDASQDDFRIDERMRDAAGHRASVHLNNSLKDIHVELPRAVSPEPILKKKHKVLQMKSNRSDTKVDKNRCTQNDHEGQTEKRVETLYESAESSSDEFKIKKAVGAKKKTNTKKQNEVSKKIVNTSSDSLPSLVIESVEALQDCNREQLAHKTKADNNVDPNTASFNVIIETRSCHSDQNRIAINPTPEDLEVESIFDKRLSSLNDTQKRNTDVSIKQQNLEDKIIGNNQENSNNVDEDNSETINWDHNYDSYEFDESTNRKLESFDTVGGSPIRAHAYSSDDLPPTVHDLNRDVSPRVFDDETEQIYVISEDESQLHVEDYFIATTPKKTSGGKKSERDKTKESQQSFITNSETHSEQLNKILIPRNENLLKLIRNSIVTGKTEDSGFRQLAEEPHQDLVTSQTSQNKLITASDQIRDTRSRKNSQQFEEIIDVGNNDLELDPPKIVGEKNLEQPVSIASDTESLEWTEKGYLNWKCSKVPQPDSPASTQSKKLKKDAINNPKLAHNKTILMTKQEIHSSMKSENENTKNYNKNVCDMHHSSPRSGSTSLFYDKSELTQQISPITLSSPESPDNNTRIRSWLNAYEESENNSNAFRVPLGEARSENSEGNSSQNIYSSSDSGVMELDVIRARIRRALQHSPESEGLDDTNVSLTCQPPQSAGKKSAAATNDSMNLGDSLNTLAKPEVVAGHHYDADSQRDVIPQSESGEFPATLNSDPDSPTTGLDDIPDSQTKRQPMQMIMNIFREFEDRCEAASTEISDEIQKHEEEGKKTFQRWCNERENLRLKFVENQRAERNLFHKSVLDMIQNNRFY